MTEPAPEGVETKDVHSQMMSDGDFETKNLPGGYLPAGVPNTDRTGTQKESGDASGATDDQDAAPAGDGTAEGTERDSGTGSGKTGAAASKTTAAKSATTKSTTSKS